MSLHLALLPGDGIGREVVPAARRVLEALDREVGLGLRTTTTEVGFDVFERTGAALPGETLELVRGCDGALLGAVSSPSHRVDGYRSPVVGLRRALDLGACVRPLATPDDPTRLRLVVLRENTEGLYAGRERETRAAPSDDGSGGGGRVAIAERVVTESTCRRLARHAAALARRHGLGRVTVVHKANVLRTSCGLFREVVLDELAREAAEAAAGASPAAPLEVAEGLVDSVAARLAVDPDGFGVLVTTNLFGDILSDVAAVHAGGLGLVESLNVGPQHVVAEPVHGSAPDLAGTKRANPLATIRAAGRLLEHLGRGEAAERVLRAAHAVAVHGPHTPDLGGDATTDQVTDAVVAQLCRTSQPLEPAEA